MRITSRAAGSRSEASSNRPRQLTLISSQAGCRAGPSRCQKHARAPQARNDGKGCAARISPHTLLFATRSLVPWSADVRCHDACRFARKDGPAASRWGVCGSSVDRRIGSRSTLGRMKGKPPTERRALPSSSKRAPHEAAMAGQGVSRMRVFKTHFGEIGHDQSRPYTF
jgi:hypothetical protein